MPFVLRPFSCFPVPCAVPIVVRVGFPFQAPRPTDKIPLPCGVDRLARQAALDA